MQLTGEQLEILHEKIGRECLKKSNILTTAVSAAIDKAKEDKKPPKDGGKNADKN